MSLADCIERDVDDIVTQWEAFARTQLPAAKRLTSRELRNKRGSCCSLWWRTGAPASTRLPGSSGRTAPVLRTNSTLPRAPRTTGEVTAN